MTLNLSQTVKAARTAALKSSIDAAGTASILALYAEPRPAPGANSAATLLASIVLVYPCGVIDDTGLHLVASGSAQAVGAGIANWARLSDGNGNWIMDVDCKQTGDTRQAELILDIAQFFPGAFVNLVSAVIAEA